LDNYAALDVLPDITTVNDTIPGYYNALHNDLTHQPLFLKTPEYIPSNEISHRGDGRFAEETHYHVNTAALILLGKWFDFPEGTKVSLLSAASRPAQDAHTACSPTVTRGSFPETRS
jgi:hypothetical protein